MVLDLPDPCVCQTTPPFSWEESLDFKSLYNLAHRTILLVAWDDLDGLAFVILSKNSETVQDI